jgi:hypothetical protein
MKDYFEYFLDDINVELINEMVEEVFIIIIYLKYF